MSSLLIGGAGLVGSHVANRIQSIVVDDLSRGSFANICCDHITASVTEYDLMDVLIERSDNVFFFAAIPVLDCDKDPEHARAVMIDGLAHVSDCCRHYGKRLIYSSSGSVYGENISATEDSPLLGDTLYALMKIEAEDVLTHSRCDFIGLRYQSVYGVAVQTGYKAVIQKFRETAGKLPVYGDGSQSYDFISAHDVAKANILAAESKCSGFYNIGTGKQTTVLELANMIGEPEFVEGPTPIKHMGCDPSKAERDFGFRYEVELKDWLACAV